MVLAALEGPLTELADGNAASVQTCTDAAAAAGRATGRAIEYALLGIEPIENNATWNAVAFERRARELDCLATDRRDLVFEKDARQPMPMRA